MEAFPFSLSLSLLYFISPFISRNTGCIWQVTTITEKTTTMVMRSGSPDLLGHIYIHILGTYDNNKTIFHRTNLDVVSFWKHHYHIIQSKTITHTHTTISNRARITIDFSLSILWSYYWTHQYEMIKNIPNFFYDATVMAWLCLGR